MLGYIFEVIKDEIRYRRERAWRAALLPPTPEPQSPPEPPSLGMRILSPPERPTVSTPPLKNWRHPFGDRGNPLLQLTQLAKARAGYYPLGRNGMWHGGVHFDSGTTGSDALSQVHCLADGEVVAYRVPEHTPLSTFYPEAGGTLEAPFASGFVLVRHHLQAPKIDGSCEEPPGLTFYSLYMHLEDWAHYESTPQLPRPSFWPYNPVHRVKPDAPDRMSGHPEQRGANVWHNDHQGKVIDFLPVGTEVIVSGTGNFRRLENSRGPTSLRNEDGALQGYVSFSYLEPIQAGSYRVNVINDPLVVRAEPDRQSAKLGKLPKGTEVTISGEGDLRKLESIAQYVQFQSLQSERKPKVFDDVVVLDQPSPIKAGELIGHLGRYQECDETAPQQKLHLEVFSDDDVEAFIASSRAWAQRLPDKHKTWLKLAKGTPVSAHQDHISASLLPIWSSDNPGSDADLLVPKSLLDGLPPERKIRLSTNTSGKTYNWYRLEGLLHDAGGKPLDGWVREQVGVTPWVSPWSWEGYDVLNNFTSLQLSLSYLFSVTGVLGEESKDRLRDRAEKWDQGRMQTRLYEIIDQDRNGKMTADELQAALRMPAKAQALAQLVIFSESEWNYRQSKWDALDEVLGHTNSAPILNWMAEKQRIKQLSWWSDVAEKIGLPKDGMVSHFHPIGLQGCFNSGCPKECIIDVYEMNTLVGVYVVSKESFQFILNKEGYEKYPCVPAGSSGVTVGYGYDLGQQTIAQVYADLSDLYSRADIQRLVSVVGKRGNDARQILGSVADISISMESAARLAVIMKKRYANDVVTAYPKVLELHPHCQGALLSLVINRGRSLVDREGQVSRLEMRQIRDDFDTRNVHLIPSRLEAMQKYWTSDANRGVGIRRLEEAEFFRKRLACNCWK